jgi:hypothetical protein
MTSRVVAVRSAWSMSASMVRFQIACLALVCGVLMPGLTALAADAEGFVVLPRPCAPVLGAAG